MKQIYQLRKLKAQTITQENFQNYGQLILPTKDGKVYDQTDAQLSLEKGIPRFYIMQLNNRGTKFYTITRHHLCTQCLGSLEGKEWLIAVAPASDKLQPNIAELAAFKIPGNCFIKLNVDTWHAGPYFEHKAVNFYNLELSDTNIVDHDTYNFHDSQLEFEIIDY